MFGSVDKQRHRPSWTTRGGRARRSLGPDSMSDRRADTTWFYTASRGDGQPGDRQGPVSEARLRELIREGWVGPDDLVWMANLADWTPVTEIPGLVTRPMATRLLAAVDDMAASLLGMRSKRPKPDVEESRPRQRGLRSQSRQKHGRTDDDNGRLPPHAEQPTPPPVPAVHPRLRLSDAIPPPPPVPGQR